MWMPNFFGCGDFTRHGWTALRAAARGSGSVSILVPVRALASLDRFSFAFRCCIYSGGIVPPLHSCFASLSSPFLSLCARYRSAARTTWSSSSTMSLILRCGWLGAFSWFCLLVLFHLLRSCLVGVLYVDQFPGVVFFGWMGCILRALNLGT
jgi:hypothetical protein